MKHHLFVGQREGKLIFLMMKNGQYYSIDAVMKEFHDFLMRKFPRGEYNLVIGNEGDDIENASKY